MSATTGANSSISTAATTATAATHEVNPESKAKTITGHLKLAVRMLASCLRLDVLSRYATENKVPLAIGIAGFAVGGSLGAALALVVTVAVRNMAKDLLTIGKESSSFKAIKEAKSALMQSPVHNAVSKQAA